MLLLRYRRMLLLLPLIVGQPYGLALLGQGRHHAYALDPALEADAVAPIDGGR